MSRRLLEGAAGYDVYGSDGRRLGKVIELVPEGEERADSVAIRRERIFLWRRRTVPVAAVAGVDPKERAVTLLLDAAGIERAHALPGGGARGGWVADRIAHYADAPIAAAQAPPIDAGAANQPSQPDEGKALASAASGDGFPSVGAEAVEDAALGEHVLFLPTAAGYVLIERSGVPPSCADSLELSDPPGLFVVVKLAQSPLPNDQRLCAYLDRLD